MSAGQFQPSHRHCVCAWFNVVLFLGLVAGLVWGNLVLLDQRDTCRLSYARHERLVTYWGTNQGFYQFQLDALHNCTIPVRRNEFVYQPVYHYPGTPMWIWVSGDAQHCRWESESSDFCDRPLIGLNVGLGILILFSLVFLLGTCNRQFLCYPCQEKPALDLSFGIEVPQLV